MSDEIKYPQRIRGGAGWFIDENTIEIEGLLGARIRLSVNQEPPPPPPPPEIVLTAWMADGDLWTEVSDRFEILEGSVEGDDLSFHIRTLADKMSAQEGQFFVNVKGLSEEPNIFLKGNGNLFSPRKPEFPHRRVVIDWHTDGTSYSLGFFVDGEYMRGYAESSNDHPYNFHYGYDIQASIPIE
jgi:hypothetical protein